MRKLFIGALIGVLGMTSASFADRGDVHYPRGGDRYDRQRYEASIRYERGSRNYDRTYVRYGQDSHYRRHDLGFDRFDRRDGYRGIPVRRSGWGFSFGYSSGYGYASDGVSLGITYSNRPSVRARYYERSYYRVPDVYERRVTTHYDHCGPVVYESREYYAPSGYYSRSSSFSGSYYRR